MAVSWCGPATTASNSLERAAWISKRVDGEDVTEQYIDINARLKNKIVLRDRLQQLLGKAVNPAHQDPKLQINISMKMELVSELTKLLQRMGKHIKVAYF